MLEKFKNIYFVGIGGIGMSALARYCKRIGKEVGGYDKTKTELTNQLANEGIIITFQEDVKNLNNKFKDPHTTLVVYTPAVPPDNHQLNYFKENQFTLVKRSKLLGSITENTPTLAICGTHGKTTTSTLLAHLYKNARQNVTAFLGGISQNYNTNLILGDPSLGNHTMVAEADEYDRSFLTLYPNTIICTSLDTDHLDIYNSKHEMLLAYTQFFNQLKPNGYFIFNHKLNPQKPVNASCFSYSLNNPDASAYVTNLRLKHDTYFFNLITPIAEINEISFSYPGLHNIENAVAAALAALLNGLNPLEVKEGLENFKGVKRRFEYHLKSEKHILIDDYAHHPEELSSFINSVKNFYPNKKITGVFQPHLFSRTKDFGSEFANALSILDQVYLLEIYPAREKPIPGITSQWLAHQIKKKDVNVVTPKELTNFIKINKPEVLLTIGAGDINKLIPDLIKALND